MIYPYTMLFGLILCTGIVLLAAEHLIKQHSCHDDNESETDRYSPLKNTLTIQTNVGDIHGQVELFNDDEVMVFKGIRYAKPPVGELRFSKPVPVNGDTIEMFGLQSAERVACVQPKSFLVDDSLIIKEDCLYLNVWVPLSTRSTSDINSNRLPVMIWIHGGSFHLGSANQDEFNGIVLATIGQVVVVTINYRLGFFGFLNAELESAPGNMGLYDQVAAITWVKENINKFGGDPEKLTVFGESAGGLSVGLLTVSPISRHLFQQAIIQSGSPYSPIRPEPKAKVFGKSLVLSKSINCSHADDIEFTASAMDCLRTVDYKVIDDYGRNENMHSQILANPMFGDAFIPTNIHDLMKDPESVHRKLKVLIGMTEHEGFAFIFPQLHHLLDSSESQSLTKTDVDLLIGELLKGRPVDPLKLSNYYFQNFTSKWNSLQVFHTMADLYGDVYINCPVYYLAKRFNDILGSENIFSYVLTEASSQSYIPVCRSQSRVCHADELVLIFGVPLRNPQLFDDSDTELSKHLVRLWTDFARSGNIGWTSSNNNWFVDLPLAKTPKFHPERTHACEIIFENLFN
ncbi:hypothetical protein HA402_014680 [Bradysia odoriphaga]|nr:hypothetical protein HA402_014680 [Bradysia odoriphaga]